MRKFLSILFVFTLILGIGSYSAFAGAPVDADGDGVKSNQDCNDNDATIYPDAPEIPCDGIDQDCDDVDLVDCNDAACSNDPSCQTGSCAPPPLNADHTGKNDLQGDFASAEEIVTLTCTQCHSNKARDVSASTHHAWDNKNLQVNNFCTIAMPNGHCIKCHPSFDKKLNDYSLPLSNDKIDCLICHAQDYSRDVVDGAAVGVKPDTMTWGEIARSVGEKVTKGMCLRCHAGAGGGNKQGDLGGSLATADANLDVHMGNCMECVDCHQWNKHQVAGAGTQHPSGTNRFSCSDCHSEADITANGLHSNGHYNWMACQTCHIPEFAKVDTTNTNWYYDVSGFTLQKLTNLKPVYKWWDGASTLNFDLLADTVDPAGTTILAGPNEAAKPANPSGQTAIKAYPFYEHPGANAIDATSNKIMPFYRNSSCGVIDAPNNRSWNESIWNCAIDLAATDWNNAYGAGTIEYSGNLGFANTVMYLNLNHEVTRANALTCTDCHQTAEGGSSNRNTTWRGWTDLGY